MQGIHYRAIQRAAGVAFPEVNAMAEPVVFLFRRLQMRFPTAKNLLANAFVAAMKAENEAGLVLIGRPNGRHQAARKGLASFPVGVTMPARCRKDKAAALELLCSRPKARMSSIRSCIVKMRTAVRCCGVFFAALGTAVLEVFTMALAGMAFALEHCINSNPSMHPPYRYWTYKTHTIKAMESPDHEFWHSSHRQPRRRQLGRWARYGQAYRHAIRQHIAQGAARDLIPIDYPLQALPYRTHVTTEIIDAHYHLRGTPRSRYQLQPNLLLRAPRQLRPWQYSYPWL